MVKLVIRVTDAVRRKAVVVRSYATQRFRLSDRGGIVTVPASAHREPLIENKIYDCEGKPQRSRRGQAHRSFRAESVTAHAS